EAARRTAQRRERISGHRSVTAAGRRPDAGRDRPFAAEPGRLRHSRAAADRPAAVARTRRSHRTGAAARRNTTAEWTASEPESTDRRGRPAADPATARDATPPAAAPAGGRPAADVDARAADAEWRG